MAYLSREDALALIVEQRSKEIIALAAKTSVAMQTFRTIPMGSKSLKMALLESFPQAQWLTTGEGTPPDVDIAKKPTTEMKWGVKEVLAEEAAVIVPIPENVIDDAEIDLWGEIETRCAESVSALIDSTFFFGSVPAGAVPGSFPVGGIVGEAIANDHSFAAGTTPVGEGGLAEDWNQAMSLVEADGYSVSDAYTGTFLRGRLRGLRDANGNLQYASNLQSGATTDMMWGADLRYVTNGAWDKTKALAVMGDPKMAVIGLRQKLTAKRLSEATIGGYNLAEQDMVALRVKIRLGFAVLVPKGLGQSAKPYPFSVLTPAVP